MIYYFVQILLITVFFCQDAILIQNITIINVDNGKTTVADILVENNRFSEISFNTPIEVPAKVLILDGRGKYIIPGLWDMHTHLDDPEMLSFNIKQNEKEDLLKLLIINGITGVRDNGGNTDQLVEWKKNTNSKRIIGPQLFFSGSILDGNPPSWSGSLIIETHDDAVNAINELKQSGVNFVKIYSNLTEQSFRDIIQYAAERNLSVSGHIPLSMRIEDVSNSGLKGIEHMTGLLYSSSTKRDRFYQQIKQSINTPAIDWATYLGTNPDVVASFDENKCIEILKLFAKNKTWQTPTLRSIWGLAHANEADLASDEKIKYHSKVYQRYWNKAHQRLASNPPATEAYRNQLKLMMRITKLMSDYDVPLLAGTDMASLPFDFAGFSLHDELALMVESGLSPLKALQTATLNPAIYFNRADEMGRIREDYLADFIILNGNPLDDINQTKSIDAVYTNGIFLNHKELDLMLKQLKQKYH